jgi:hypothetical protein
MPVIEGATTLSENVGDAIVDAGDLALDLAFGSPDGRSMSGRRLLRAVLLLMIASAIVGAVIWRRRSAQLSAADRAAAG